MLSEKIATEKWGAKVIEQIAGDLQKEMPGLKGFSARNLINMRHFYNQYQSVIITQGATAQIRDVRRADEDDFTDEIGQLEFFWSISFTHHILILNKCKDPEERFFYIEQAAAQFWSVSVLEHYMEANLFSQQGKLPNNFNKTLPGELKPTALKVFQDEYLMDFISSNDTEDERIFEDKVVADRNCVCFLLS